MKSFEINFDFKLWSKIYEKIKMKKNRYELNTKYKKNILIINNHNFFCKMEF